MASVSVTVMANPNDSRLVRIGYCLPSIFSPMTVSPEPTLTFDNRFTTQLPVDPQGGRHNRQVAEAFSRVEPIVPSSPRIIAHSSEMVQELGLTDDAIASDWAARIFTGAELAEGSDPFAMNYGGHQFGNWAGQLGDGRAIALGEVLDRHGKHQTLQLKGAGQTPYSRRADGLAVLRSSIREFLCSEAMFHLGVPTTRALSLALTGDRVMRDQFYDGHPAMEPGAVVCRVAPSFIRFGSFQLPASRGNQALVAQMADFTIRHYFPHLVPDEAETKPLSQSGDYTKAFDREVYAAWFDEVATRSRAMVLDWMRVGFVHGVMNTDNMSIHGLTIDYGPYGWTDDFNLDWTPNTTDFGQRRYRFGQQPNIVQWNLFQLAEALVGLVGETGPLEESLTSFATSYMADHHLMTMSKMGLSDHAQTATSESDVDKLDGLAADLFRMLSVTETDMTIFFRRLADLPAGGDLSDDHLLGSNGLGDAYYAPESISDTERDVITSWVGRYRDHLVAAGIDDESRRVAMNEVNPKYVLRNYLAQEAIEKSDNGDHEPIMELLDVVRRPYDEQPNHEAYAARRPDWARTKPGCSTLSCSS